MCRNQRKDEGMAETDLQRLLHVFERAIGGDIKYCPSLLRKPLEPRTGEPLRDMLDFVDVISRRDQRTRDRTNVLGMCRREMRRES